MHLLQNKFNGKSLLQQNHHFRIT